MQDPLLTDQIKFSSDQSDSVFIKPDENGNLGFTDNTLETLTLFSDLTGIQNIDNVYIVGKSGSGARFTTIQSAINDAPLNSSETNPQVILIFPGSYYENISINKNGLYLIGLGQVKLYSALDATPDAVGSTHTVSILAGGGVVPQKVYFNNVSFYNAHQNKACVSILGAASSLVGNTGIFFKDCNFNATSGSGNYTIHADTVGKVVVHGGSLSFSDLDILYLNQISDFFVSHVDRIGAVSISWDAEGNLPNLDPNKYTFNFCSNVGFQTELTPCEISISEDGPVVEFNYSKFKEVILNFSVIINSIFSSIDKLNVTGTSTLNFDHTQYTLEEGLTNEDSILNSTFLSGTATIDNDTSVDVVFPIPRSSNGYVVNVTPLGSTSNLVPYITGKLASGFTINFSGPVTLDLDWNVKG